MLRASQSGVSPVKVEVGARGGPWGREVKGGRIGLGTGVRESPSLLGIFRQTAWHS